MGYFGFVATNYQNFGGDRESWVYNRIIIVRCDNVIPENKQDKQLVEHLLEEKEYIVSLAIKGLKQVIDNTYKYNIPESCKLLNEEYQVENHSFLAFMKECVIDRPNPDKIEDSCTTKLFYDVYKEWCKDNNNGYKETKQQVKKILVKMGKGETKKTNGGNTYYKAITLSQEAKRDYERVYNPDSEDDVPDSDVNCIDSEEARKALGLDNDSSCDFGENNITNFDDVNSCNWQYGDLRPSEQTLIEAGIFDPDFIKTLEGNNEKV